MTPDFPPSDRHPAAVVITEVVATVVSLLLYPFGIRNHKKRTPRKSTQRTIVFVHGYLGNPSSFLPLSIYLKARGHKSILYYKYPSDVGIEQAAIGLRSYLKKNVRGGRVDLVCHSLGGLVAKVYLQELGGRRRVDSCVTLGTPHSGTYNAYWLWSRVGQELRPDSKLLARIAAGEAKSSNVRNLSIVAGSDNIVIPRVFAKGTQNVVHIPHVGHMGMLFTPAVFKSVGDFLAIT